MKPLVQITLRFMAPALLLAGLTAGTAAAQDEGGKIAGNYLYARPEAAADRAAEAGGLTVRFSTPGKRLVVAFGWKYRKDRMSRSGSTEAQREWFKPYRAKLADEGKTAVFAVLPPDFYDIIVFDLDAMVMHEGIEMLSDDNPELAGNPLLGEVSKTLSRPDGRISGVDAFFNEKLVDRLETDGFRAAALLQQMRTDKAFAESGDTIKGCIHSVDIFWLLKGKQEGGWQVMNRQQIFREELTSRELFRHQFHKEMQGLRVGMQMKDVGTLLGK